MPSGFLCLDKPSGITSRDAVNAIQRLVRPQKVGHAGTLDPLATGVLAIAIGSATRLIRHVQDQPKRYRGTFELGLSSDTEDITGQITRRCDPTGVTEERLRDVLSGFVGSLEQTPPQFSAVHVQGQRAYDLARKGVAMDLAPRRVEIFSMELADFASPLFTIDVECSGGTYIRSLGRDIGERLGCGAVMTALRRTAVGRFALDTAIPLDAVTRDSLPGQLMPLALAVAHLPVATLSPAQIRALRCGQTIAFDDGRLTDGAEVALFDDAGQLAGVGIVDREQHRLRAPLVLPQEST